MDLPSLEETILRRKLRLAGHVVSMPPHRLPQKVLYREPNSGRRFSGGQKKRFKHNMKNS